MIGEEIFSFLNDESCDFYGSSLLGLFEESSFINLHTSRNLHGCKSNLSTFHVIERANFNKNLKIKVDSLIVDLANNDISYDGVRKMYSIAECFDDYPPLWPALRVLLEWARSNKVSKTLKLIMDKNNFHSFFEDRHFWWPPLHNESF